MAARKNKNKKRRGPEKPAPPAVKSASASMAPASWRNADSLTALALCLLIAVSYFPASMAGLVWDDVVLIQARTLHYWSGLWDIWFAPRTLTDFEGHYWPLLYTTFWLEHKLWGLAPLGYHLTNLLLHAALTLLLWRLLLRLEVPGAVFAAALFAVHPLHVESVVWVIGRKDIMASLFYLASAFAYINFITNQRRAHYVWALLLFVLALISKSVAVTLPVALLIWHWWKQGRVTAADLNKVLPFFLLALAITAADLSFYKGRDTTVFDYSLIERVLIAARSVGFYFGKLIWPGDLAVIYPRWQVSYGDYLAWGCAIGSLTVLALLWRFRHRIGRGPLAGALFFVVTLSPSLGFVDYGYMLYSFVADRYQYLASIGVTTVLAAAATVAYQHALKRLPDAAASPIIMLILPAAVLIVLATITWNQAGVYRDNLTFYQHIISHNPTVRYMHHSLGREYHDMERYEEALAAYRIDLRLAGEQPSPRIRISKNYSAIGLTLEKLGRSAEAEEHFRTALEMTPRFPSTLDNLGGFLIGQKRFRDALQYFETLLEIAPGNARYHVGYGVTLSGIGRHNEALRIYDRALALDPGLTLAHSNRKILLEFIKNQPGAGE